MGVSRWSEADRLHAQAELVYRKCAADPVYFFQNFWMIQHPSRGIVKFVLREPQREILQDVWAPGKNSITLKARQIGWSTLTAAFCFWVGFFRPAQRIMVLSKGEREAVELLSKAKFGYKYLPRWMLERGPRLLDNAQQRMTFDDDSQILSLPGGSDPARGFTGNLVVVDEFGFLPNEDTAWPSIKPVADIGGQLIVLGTANGFGNQFHKLWIQATLGEISFVPSFYSWRAVPERDDDWYTQQAAELLPWQLAQEFPDNPDEAFVKSGQSAFDYDVVSDIRPVDPVDRGDMVDGRFVSQGGGPLSVWEFPVLDQDYVMSADTSEGLEFGDYSCVDVLTPEGTQVAQWHGKCEPDELGRILVALGNWYNTALAVPEANNMGIATIAAMRLLEYGRIWRRQSVNSTSSGFTQQLGFMTTRVTKPLIISELSEALRAGMVIRSQRTKDELLQFVRDGKGGFHGSPFDDAVLSLALANHGRPFVFAPEYRPQTELVRGSFDWHLDRADRAAKPVLSGRGIGAFNRRDDAVL